MVKKGPIILVEDDVEDQLLIRESLESFDSEHVLHIFPNGEEALNYLMETTEVPFVIICDINMPKMDGLTMRTALHNNEFLRKKSIPFVFFSTSASIDAVNKAYALTVQGFFVKPSTFSDLTRVLQMIVSYWNTCKHPNMM